MMTNSGMGKRKTLYVLKGPLYWLLLILLFLLPPSSYKEKSISSMQEICLWLFTDGQLDRLGACFTLDVATPVELALTALFHSEMKRNN